MHLNAYITSLLAAPDICLELSKCKIGLFFQLNGFGLSVINSNFASVRIELFLSVGF